MKNLHGQSFKALCFLIIAVFFLLNSIAQRALSYETMVLHYPDHDWKPVSYERLEEENEVIAKFVPFYDDKVYWREMLTFHSYKDAKKSDTKADTFVDEVIGKKKEKFKNIKVERISTTPENAIFSWCDLKGTKTELPQCGLVRVTSGIETMIEVEYASRNLAQFKEKTKLWLPILQNAVVYYSYWRWNRIMNKALCVEL